MAVDINSDSSYMHHKKHTRYSLKVNWLKLAKHFWYTTETFSSLSWLTVTFSFFGIKLLTCLNAYKAFYVWGNITEEWLIIMWICVPGIQLYLKFIFYKSVMNTCMCSTGNEKGKVKSSSDHWDGWKPFATGVLVHYGHRYINMHSQYWELRKRSWYAENKMCGNWSISDLP